MVSEPKMREILFRGKRLYGVGWVEGSLVVFPKTKRTKILVWNQADLDFDAIEVHPETVGQFTGLFAMDDNDASDGGEMIFDGDIVDVVWSDEIGEPHSTDNCVVYLDDHTTMHLLEFSNRIRLVGNIHDNPALLEVSHV